MDESPAVKKEIEKLKALSGVLESLCNNLTTYEERLCLYKNAIEELQKFVVKDAKDIAMLNSKVDKIEKKYGKDVMFQ